MSSDIFVLVEHLDGKVEDITYVCLSAALDIAKVGGGDVVAVLLGHDLVNLTADLAATRVLSVDHISLAEYSPDVYLQVLSDILKEYQPRAFIAGHTSVGMDLVCGLAVRSNHHVISQCQRIIPDDGALKFISQICGGKIFVEGDLPVDEVMISMAPGGYKPEQGKSEKSPDLVALDPPQIDELRIRHLETIKPDLSDVDISKSEVLISVGRGLKNESDLELAEDLAAALGGQVCGSRPIVDQGWLPTSRLVGKSGQTVKPKLYLALGISGAPEHIQAIQDSELIIAVNTDPKAPIYNLAQYGAEVDMIDFLNVLTDMVKVRI